MSRTTIKTLTKPKPTTYDRSQEQITVIRKQWLWASHLQAELEKCLDQFWHMPIHATLVGISESMQYFWEFEDFYVSQKNLFKQTDAPACPIQLRMHYQCCEHFFNTALGPNEHQSFKLSELTAFEIFTLEKLSVQLFGVVEKALGSVSPPAMQASHHDKMHHILWYISPATLGKPTDNITPKGKMPLVLSIPESILTQAVERLTVQPLAPSEQFADEQFLFNCYAAGLTFRIGSTKVSLTEMQELAVGDMVILENSRLNEWLLWHDKRQTWVRIPLAIEKMKNYLQKFNSVDTVLAGESSTMKAQAPQSFHWENLQVDLVASFEPLKFPIKRLKEISEGLVLEVAGLTENSININVDGQPVAWGELVIVGDKFAVRIQGVYEQGSPANALTAQEGVQYATQPIINQPVETHNQPTEPQATQTNETKNNDKQSTSDLLNDLNLDESDFDDLGDDGEL